MRRIILAIVLFSTLVAGAQQLPLDVKAKMETGTAAFRAGDFQGALQSFNEVIAADPQNIFAHNLAANCYMGLGNFAAAAESFQRALKIQPDQPQNLSGLARAYTWAGLTGERDELVKHIRELAKTGVLPKNFGFVFDSFDLGERKVLVTEFPQLAGGYHFRYQFDVYDPARKLVVRYALESDDIDQISYQKEHPKEAAEGGRRFSLDSYRQNAHGLMRFYDGEPRYEDVKAEVLGGLRGEKKPSINSTYNSPAQPSQPAASTPK